MSEEVKKYGVIFVMGLLLTLVLMIGCTALQDSKAEHNTVEKESNSKYSYEKNQEDWNPSTYDVSRGKYPAKNDVEPEEDLDGSMDEDNGDY